MRRLVTIFALAALAGGCACLGGGERRDAASGTRLAQRACAGCHAVGSAGLSPNPRSPPFRTLAAQLPGAALGAQLEAIVRNGHGEMPPIYMSPDEIRDLAAYIRATAA